MDDQKKERKYIYIVTIDVARYAFHCKKNVDALLASMNLSRVSDIVDVDIVEIYD